jgi:tetratricopeptide (TPR) repeat protein
MASERFKRQVERLLHEAEQAIARLEWEIVRARALAVLAIDPENGDAEAFLAIADRGLSRHPVAATAQPSPPPTSAPAPSAQPTTFSNGRYQVKRFLGEGGKKKVYLAHDTLLDRDVAFALIKAEGLDEVARTRIRREAQAMGRLGSHPHIVTVFDLGQEQGQPFMVAEFMGEGDVAGLIEKAPEHRLPLEQAVRIAVETCRGLEYAHQRGIIHRDLKPGNVWLTAPSTGSGQAQGTAKIGDFGLAVALDRSRLTQHGMMVGTVAYMPPEQALGGEVTPRSDLYSLGCMLYEMVTGRPPFLGDDPVAIIGQHINTPPVAPTWHNGQCPRPLEALILRLLAKDPGERPQSTADVRAALEAIDTTDVGAPLAAPSDQAHALDSLAGGVFVGRQREMGELKAALEDALSGRGRLLTLVGEPGIGKTRTAQELATYAGLRQCQVLWGRCYEGAGAPPYWPWVQAIRSYVQERDPQQLRSEMGAGAADIAEVVSDVRERLPDLKPPPQLEPEQARFRLFDSIATFLKSAGRRQPLVLLLEDLHWADRPSLLLLEFLARELGGSRLLVLGTYRDVEVSRRHPLSQTLGELTRERLFQRVLLRGLSQEDVGRFIELVSGLTPPRGLVEAVYRQTEGNPLFVTEVVRLLVQEGSLTPQPPLHLRDGEGETARGRGGEAWTVRIPEGVREVIGRRLDRLSERCNQTLTIASVIGREFTLEQLNALIVRPSTGSGRTDSPAAHGELVEPGARGTGLDMTEDRLLEVLEEALAARVIEELPRTVGRYQFTHALIQETLVGELTTTRRVRLHARIAEALEALYGAQSEARAAELAHHFVEAQMVLGTEKLVRYSLIAGERALAAYAWEEALRHFQRGLAAKEGQSPVGAGQALPSESQGAASRAPTERPLDAETAALLFGLGRAQAGTLERHQLQQAVATLQRAFDYYAAAGDVAGALAVAQYPLVIAPLGRTGVAGFIPRALKLVPPDSLAAGRLLCSYGVDLGRVEGDYENAQAAFAQALAIARREGDPALEVRTLAAAANVDYFHLRFQEGLEGSRRAIALAGRLDDQQAAWSAHLDASRILTYTGEVGGAQQHAAAALELAERLRGRSQLALSFWGNARLLRLQGGWQGARQFSDRGLAVAPQDVSLLGDRVLLEYEVGDFGQGEAYLERLLATIPPAAARPGLQYALPAVTIPWIARITGVLDHLGVAAAAAPTVLSSPFANPLFALYSRAGLGLLAVLRDDAAAAAEQYGPLQSQVGTMSLAISIDRLLGLLAQTMGNLDKAAEHFEDALAFCRKAGYRPELAWTCCDYADMLLQRASAVAGETSHPVRPFDRLRAGSEPVEGRGSTSSPRTGGPSSPRTGGPSSPRTEAQQDRAKAMSLLDEALAISRELGMRPLMERVLSRREILTA